MERKYTHVIVVGIDGAGGFFRDANVPHFNEIFKNGAVTYNALSSRPSISAECWGSMLLGVGPEVHKLTNGILESTSYPADSEFPSLFRRIREAYPDAELGSYCDWNPITHGIVENGIGVSHDTARDTELTRLSAITSAKKHLIFSLFSSTALTVPDTETATVRLHFIKDCTRLINL